MTTVIGPSAHSRFGGSVADRYMNCPGSVALCETVPKKAGSIHAKIGTAAHALAETCLKQSQDAAEFIGEFFPVGEHRDNKFIVTDEMAVAVQVYLDAVREELALSASGELYVEQGFAFELPSADPGEVFGTNDAMVYHPTTGRLRVFDYKHGQGVSVSADDNSQLKFYATGAVFSKPDWNLAEVILTIVQPRARDVGDENGVKDWPMDVLDLLEFQGDLDTAIAVCKGAAPSLATGSWCRWCDAAAVCPAKEAEALAATTLDFASVTLVSADDMPVPKTLDTDRLAKIVNGLDIINAWMGQCQEYLEGLIMSGVEVPGWKAVEKIGRAKWIDDPTQVAAHVEMLFGVEEDQITPRKLATIGEAEKLLKAAGATKEQIDDFKLKFTIKESSGLTIARASDRRPAVNAIASDFGSVKL